jgi:hypothetical protein
MLVTLKEYYLEKMTPMNSPYFYHPVELDDIFVWQIQCEQQQAPILNLDESFFLFEVGLSCTKLMKINSRSKKCYLRELVPNVTFTVSFLAVPAGPWPPKHMCSIAPLRVFTPLWYIPIPPFQQKEAGRGTTGTQKLLKR